ncbi:unnamed protein product [Mortierella alpina]
MDNHDAETATDSAPQGSNVTLHRIDINDQADLEEVLINIAQHKQAWSNWTGVQSCKPSRIFHPQSRKDIVAIISLAKALQKKIRCVGGGYSLSSCSVVEDDGFLVMVKNMNTIFTPMLSKDGSWTVEIETGVSIKDLETYLRNYDPPLTLSSNAVFDCALYGGLLSLGCHGAATRESTLSDTATCVKIVGADGTLNVFTKEKDHVEFAAATINLGLFGIIYSYTIQVEPIFKLQLVDSYPPQTEFFASAKEGGPRLKALVQGSEQIEFLYFPFSCRDFSSPANDRVFVRQWHRTDLPIKPSQKRVAFQRFRQRLLLRLAQNVFYKFITRFPKTTPYISYPLFALMPRDKKVLYVPEAIHHYGGIELFGVTELEMAFKVDDHFENIIDPWNFAMHLMYGFANRGEFPLNLALEMRFIRASRMTMSNAYDDDPEAVYCMIQVVSKAEVRGFNEFTAKLGKYWMDTVQARPHWAKVWEHIPGIVPHLRKLDSARFDQFEAIRKKYDPEAMFMNATFAGILGHDTQDKHHPRGPRQDAVPTLPRTRPRTRRLCPGPQPAAACPGRTPPQPQPARGTAAACLQRAPPAPFTLPAAPTAVHASKPDAHDAADTMQQQMLRQQQQHNTFLNQSDSRSPVPTHPAPGGVPQEQQQVAQETGSSQPHEDQRRTPEEGLAATNVRSREDGRPCSPMERHSMESPPFRQDIPQGMTQRLAPPFNPPGNPGPPGFDSQFGAPAMIPVQTPNGIVYMPMNRMAPPPGFGHFPAHPSDHGRANLQQAPQFQTPFQQAPQQAFHHQQQMFMHQQMLQQQQQQHQSQLQDIESQINQFLFKKEPSQGTPQENRNIANLESPRVGQRLTVQEVEEAQAKDLQRQLHNMSLGDAQSSPRSKPEITGDGSINGGPATASMKSSVPAHRLSSILENRFQVPSVNNTAPRHGQSVEKAPLSVKDIDFYSDKKYDPYRPSSHTFDLLTRDARILCQELKPKPEEETRKLALLKKLSDIAREVFGEAEVLPFGSSGNGLALANADMDVCVFLNTKPGSVEVSPVEFVERIGDRLEEDADFENILQLKRARVPIVKLNHVNGIACDIGYQNDLAIWNTRMLRAYCKIDERVRDIVVIIKLWAKRRKINNPYTGSLSSYAYVLLVIHVLQKRGVLPNLQAIVAGNGSIPFWPCQGFNRYFFEDIPNLMQHWQPTPEALNQSVGELLYEFFRYYASEFRYANQVVSIRSGGLLTKEAKEWTKDFTQAQQQQQQQQQPQQQPQQPSESSTETDTQVETPPPADAKPVVKNRYLFCIEDPFELDHNVGRPVDRYSYVSNPTDAFAAKDLILNCGY